MNTYTYADCVSDLERKFKALLQETEKWSGVDSHDAKVYRMVLDLKGEIETVSVAHNEMKGA